jgi:hypothetical protein
MRYPQIRDMLRQKLKQSNVCVGETLVLCPLSKFENGNALWTVVRDQHYDDDANRSCENIRCEKVAGTTRYSLLSFAKQNYTHNERNDARRKINRWIQHSERAQAQRVHRAF